MIYTTRILLLITLCVSIAAPGLAASSKKAAPSASEETLNQYVEELKKNPADDALREKIIKFASTIKPEVPESAERSLIRGATFAQRATDSAGYRKAIAEFKTALNTAPWLALAYYNLGVVQEKAGLYAEALQNLKFYLLAAPTAKNARDVKNKIYALEADVEDLQGNKNSPPQPTPAQTPASAETGAGKSLAVAARPSLEIESEKDLHIMKIPIEKRAKLPNFIGNWYFKDTLRGEDLTIHAFEISKNTNGDLVVTPPVRAADSYATILQFEISDKTLKLQMKWKMRSTVGYWKTETYELVLSDDNKTLIGSHNQRSVGGRSVDMDRTLFRQ